MLLNHKLRNSRQLLDGLKSRDDESRCATSLLYLKAADKRSGGRTWAPFASIICCPTLCEWRGVLHTGDWAFAVVPLHVYSARSEQRACIYLNISHHYGRCTILPALLLPLRFRKTGLLLWEGSGDHLPHKTRRANEKQHSPVTRTVGYFTEITVVGASCGYLDDLRHKNVSQRTRCTVRWLGNILHRYNTIVCHLKLL